jgi:hypothetical protein
MSLSFFADVIQRFTVSLAAASRAACGRGEGGQQASPLSASLCEAPCLTL